MIDGRPPADLKIAWIGLSPRVLCEVIKDMQRNRGRDFAALTTHVNEDKLVAWSGIRVATVPRSRCRDVFITKFKEWAAAGGPYPNS